MIVNNYNLDTRKNVPNSRLAVLSDIHFSEADTKERDYEILDTLDEINPSAILVPGDLYNRYSYDGPSIKNFIDLATEIADVFYVPGNSELNVNTIIPIAIYSNQNPHFHFMGNSSGGVYPPNIKLGNFSISSLRLDWDFYLQSEEKRIELLLTKYRVYIERLTKLLEDENFNILLCHDPIIIEAAKELKSMSNFDLVVSGHNHGGLFPESFKPLFKILGRDLEKLYPTYKKGMKNVNGTEFLVSEGVTKYHSEMGPLKVLEHFHDSTIEVVRVRKKDN